VVSASAEFIKPNKSREYMQVGRVRGAEEVSLKMYNFTCCSQVIKFI
jgi:hypothetical protein